MLIEQAIQAIIENPSPVLFTDTCSLLDVSRATTRTRVANVSAVQTIASSAVNVPRGIWPILIKQVHKEWQRHAVAVRDEISLHIGNTDANVQRVYDVLQHLSPAKRHLPIRMTSFSLEIKLEQLAHALMDVSLPIEQDSACLHSAMLRAIDRRAPAEQGGSIEDCLILEHCLALAKELSTRNFATRWCWLPLIKRTMVRPARCQLHYSKTLTSLI